MTFLPDLRETKLNVIGLEDRSDGKCPEVDPRNEQVLAERAVSHISAPPVEFLHLLVTEKTYLAVPRTGVGVTVYTVRCRQVGRRHGMFFSSFLFADAYSFYTHYVNGQKCKRQARL